MNDLNNYKSININGAELEWNLEKGTFNFYGIPSTLFWNDPSLLSMFKPLVVELGKEMFCLQVAYSSSLGTDEDYHNIVTQFGQTFEEGFLNWGKAVSGAGWGVFELPSFNIQTLQAKVIVHNPWELSMQKKLNKDQQWGCPFLQGKIIGIFNHALKHTCWADEECFVDHDNIRVEFTVYSHPDSIQDKIEALREKKEKQKVLDLKVAINEYKNSLEETRLLQKDILTTLPDMLWLKDTQGIYLACNPEFELFFGAKEDEIVGKTDYDFVDAKLADFFRENDKKAMYANRASVNEEWITYASDGHRALLETTKTPLKNKYDEIIGVLGIGHDITKRYEAEEFAQKYTKILKMIATGVPASKVYNEIALMYEARHDGLRCSLLELENGKLLHGGAPSMPKEYCDAVDGLENGPSVGSCGTSTFYGHRVLVEDIATDSKWKDIKDYALPHGMRSCWSEPIIDSQGTVLGAFGMYYDYPALPNEKESEDLASAARLASIVMEREQSHKHMYNLAYTDELTKLASRTHLYKELDKILKISKRNNSKFAILYVDLDDFKSVNDTLGHDIGDILLQEVAKRLKNINRDDTFTARLSGDEFCLVVKDINSDYDAAHIAKRCLESVSKPLKLSKRNFTPACSIGIASYPNDGKDISTLLKSADTALYFAKEHGKNKYSFYVSELTKKAEHTFQIEQYLREAIEKEELTLVYQPQINAITNEIVGFEALSRWVHPVLGNVPPTEFIATAEKIGMIKQLTQWVLKTACNQAVKWREMGLLKTRMSINISPSHFIDKEIIDLIKYTLSTSGIVASELELEVTENIAQTDNDNLFIFKELKKLGVLIAIDDFGTGYSSFASLKHLNVDCLKIDKYFIDDLHNDEESNLLVKTMIQLGHNLKYGIIAEGVETLEQYNVLKELNCETIQGYFFSKPLNSEQMTKLLSQSSNNFLMPPKII